MSSRCVVGRVGALVFKQQGFALGLLSTHNKGPRKEKANGVQARQQQLVLRSKKGTDSYRHRCCRNVVFAKNIQVTNFCENTKFKVRRAIALNPTPCRVPSATATHQHLFPSTTSDADCIPRKAEIFGHTTTPRQPANAALSTTDPSPSEFPYNTSTDTRPPPQRYRAAPICAEKHAATTNKESRVRTPFFSAGRGEI